MSCDDFNSMLALNVLFPYTYDFAAEREGLMVTEMFNSRRKEPIKSTDLFPYLSRRTPTWLQDPEVEKARQLYERSDLMMSKTDVPVDIEKINSAVREEIEIERSKPKPNEFKLHELEKLLGERTNGKVP